MLTFSERLIPLGGKSLLALSHLSMFLLSLYNSQGEQNEYLALCTSLEDLRRKLQRVQINSSCDFSLDRFRVNRSDDIVQLVTVCNHF